MLILLEILLVCLLWGATNPLIRRGSIGVDRAGSSGIAQLQSLITRTSVRISVYLHPHPITTHQKQYIVPLLLNLSGSVAYYRLLAGDNAGWFIIVFFYALPATNIIKPDYFTLVFTSTGPIVNAGTLLVTILVGKLLGERNLDSCISHFFLVHLFNIPIAFLASVFLGAALVAIGASLAI